MEDMVDIADSVDSADMVEVMEDMVEVMEDMAEVMEDMAEVMEDMAEAMEDMVDMAPVLEGMADLADMADMVDKADMAELVEVSEDMVESAADLTKPTKWMLVNVSCHCKSIYLFTKHNTNKIIFDCAWFISPIGNSKVQFHFIQISTLFKIR